MPGQRWRSWAGDFVTGVDENALYLAVLALLTIPIICAMMSWHGRKGGDWGQPCT